MTSVYIPPRCKQLRRKVNPGFYVPWPISVHCRYKISRKPPQQGVKYTGCNKVCDFRSKSPFRCKVGPQLLRMTNRKSQVADRSLSVPTTLSDLQRQDARGPFSVEYPSVRSYRLISNEIWRGNTWGWHVAVADSSRNTCF